jgi:hypothetical protein
MLHCALAGAASALFFGPGPENLTDSRQAKQQVFNTQATGEPHHGHAQL